MGILIKYIKVKNYKSLENITVELNDYIVLVGKNNSGKTNLIQALGLAFGYEGITKEDIFVSKSSIFNYEKKVEIEVLIVPVNENKEREKTFDDSWSLAFGDAISVM